MEAICEKIWEEKYTAGDSARDAAIKEIAEKLGVSFLFAVLLYNRGYKSAESARSFLHFDSTDFHDPYLMADMDKAVDRILSAVENGEKIYIYGDYDVDGVTSVSMLYKYLTSLGAETRIKIPKREGEGYGVSKSGVDAIAADGAGLVITVDTGITANSEVALAHSLGVDFVVTDHHECHGELPQAYAVVNPHRPDCGYPFKELAGVGVIFKVICACEIRRAHTNGIAVAEAVRHVSEEYCELVAVGTIADVMPLTDENRLIVSFGLSRLSRGEGCRGLTALLAATGKKGTGDAVGKRVTSGMIGFGIAPRINAAGRISDALIAVRLLLAEDSNTAQQYAEELCEINRQRQAEENRIAVEAYTMLDDGKHADDKVIILDSDSWQQGIIGIVASRITEKYGLPSILVSFKGSIDGEPSPDDDGKGSGRSINGMNLVGALEACDELLVKYGGHELAAGLTVKRGKIEEFRKRMNDYAREHITEDMMKISVELDCELEADEINMSFASEIQNLEPFGVGNATPRFVLKNARIARISYIGGGKHTRLVLEKDGIMLTALYFGVGENDFEFSVNDTVDALFTLDINDFRGVRSVQLLVQELRTALAEAERIRAEREKYKAITAGKAFFESDDIIPSRDDFAKVYTILRREFRTGNDIMSVSEIQRELDAAKEKGINYVKLKLILAVLNELNICGAEEIAEDVYKINIFFNASKTSIDKSSILKKLRGQCRQYDMPESL